MIIKAVLILGLLGVALYAFSGRVSSSQLAARRVLGACALTAGILAVLFPSATNWMAAHVGVTRGADLLTYSFIVVSLFVWVGLYRRLLDMQNQIVALTRRMALDATPASVEVKAMSQKAVE